MQYVPWQAQADHQADQHDNSAAEEGVMDPTDQPEAGLVEQVGHVKALLQREMGERYLIRSTNENLGCGEQSLGLSIVDMRARKCLGDLLIKPAIDNQSGEACSHHAADHS